MEALELASVKTNNHSDVISFRFPSYLPLKTDNDQLNISLMASCVNNSYIKTTVKIVFSPWHIVWYIGIREEFKTSQKIETFFLILCHFKKIVFKFQIQISVFSQGSKHDANMWCIHTASPIMHREQSQCINNWKRFVFILYKQEL